MLRSAASPSHRQLWKNLQTYQLYGANTDVGKTIFSTILCKAFGQQKDRSVWYLKPVSTGPLDEQDERHIGRFAPGTNVKTLFQFGLATSPHVAVAAEQGVHVSCIPSTWS
jgi:dethiobiotin synthetase/adenosylmethionine--8-amino-7-oxononanoate aminotransferase